MDACKRELVYEKLLILYEEKMYFSKTFTQIFDSNVKTADNIRVALFYTTQAFFPHKTIYEWASMCTYIETVLRQDTHNEIVFAMTD